jgi:hypothetical protein
MPLFVLMQITHFLCFMGVMRMEINKVLSLLLTMLLCFVYCTAAPVNANDNVPPAASHSSELREAAQAPLAPAVQEESGISLHKLLQVDKLLLAKLTVLVLKEMYPLSSVGNTLLPVTPAYNRTSLTDTILTTGP